LILFILYRYVWPPLSKAMNDRQAMINKGVEDSHDANRKLRQAEERYDAAIVEVRSEAARIRDDARADATRIREELKAQADAEVERIRLRGEEQLAGQRDQAVRQLKTEIGGLSMQLAQRIVGDSLIDEDRKRATVDTFLSELDALEPKASTSGGQS
ncbi:MAG: F0F1 ATP synthase subunit B, partial [Pseudonocardia sp.]|nr:F0F1 ATP synthase subunit B [Pseudonocardia sp.]